MPRYRISGLSVQSEMELPGLISGQEDRGEPDVDIRFGTVPETLESPIHSGPTWEIERDRFLLRVLDIARFLMVQGRHIVVEPLARAEPADIATFLIGGVFGILLHQRGLVVLHASGVAVNGKAVLFCGPSGAGKSTLAAALNKRGFLVVTDDVCAVTLGPSGAAMIHPDGRQMKLWGQAVAALGLDAQRGSQIRSQIGKFYVDPANPGAPSSLPIAAVYVLRRERAPLASGIEAPRLVDAARLLERNAYRPMFIKRMGQKEIYFRAASAIANEGGVYWLTRKFVFSEMPAVLALLEGHWLEQGWTGAS